MGLLPQPDWRDFANCRGEDPAIFYPTSAGVPERAQKLCSECIVSDECHAFAQTSYMGKPEQFGIWDGENYEKHREPNEWRSLECEVCERKWRWKRSSGSWCVPETCSAKCARILRSRRSVVTSKFKATG